MGYEGVESIYLSQDRDQWRLFCEHFNGLSVSIKEGKFLSSRAIESQEILCSVVLVR
jgi:hypothetical protein